MGMQNQLTFKLMDFYNFWKVDEGVNGISGWIGCYDVLLLLRHGTVFLLSGFRGPNKIASSL